MNLNMSTKKGLKTITEEKIALDMLKRYTGSRSDMFQPYILLVNFHRYIEIFSKAYPCKITQGSAITVAHCKEKRITMINYGIGSPAAALIVKLLSFIKTKAILTLGMCGGLREGQEIGDYFNPVAAIREEGTSFAYLPSRCPSLSSFVTQRYVCEILEKHKKKYYTGVIHTTNIRFWEFMEDFREKLQAERANAIDMECATLFTVGFASFVPVGAMMLISDIPLKVSKIKTFEIMEKLFKEDSPDHIKFGVETLTKMRLEENEYEFRF